MAQQPLPIPKLNLDNIQGDILLGLPKKVEQYLFFQITDVPNFKKGLEQLVPLITTANQVVHDYAKIAESKEAAKRGGHPPPLLPMSGVQISFSKLGLDKLQMQGTFADGPFNLGQRKDAPSLNDPTDPNTKELTTWIPEFKKDIHVVIFVSGDKWERVDDKVKKINQFFGKSILQIFTVKGNVRPGPEKGHEHFGFLDGVSQPAIIGFNGGEDALPGQHSVPPGIILLGNDGDNTTNPPWSKDGSFLAFRFLEQLVPEFNTFLETTQVPGFTGKQSAELLGARLVGRWKSGAPVDLTPKVDDPDLGATIHGNNNFDFNMFKPVVAGEPNDDDQIRCPFVAHVRKTNPRSDLDESGITPHRIIRQGIPFGPEVTESEKRHRKTEHSRGLAFVSYQSSIQQGFRFVQTLWANNKNFVVNKKLANGQPIVPGIDAIIGQAPPGQDRIVSGVNPNDPTPAGDFKLPQLWVIPKGGEYFFSPSISTLKTIATA